MAKIACYVYVTSLVTCCSRVVIAVEKLPRRRRRKKCDASTSQSNNFGVSRKSFTPSTPGSNSWASFYYAGCTVYVTICLLCCCCSVHMRNIKTVIYTAASFCHQCCIAQMQDRGEFTCIGWKVTLCDPIW